MTLNDIKTKNYVMNRTVKSKANNYFANKQKIAKSTEAIFICWQKISKFRNFDLILRKTVIAFIEKLKKK